MNCSFPPSTTSRSRRSLFLSFYLRLSWLFFFCAFLPIKVGIKATPFGTRVLFHSMLCQRLHFAITSLPTTALSSSIVHSLPAQTSFLYSSSSFARHLSTDFCMRFFPGRYPAPHLPVKPTRRHSLSPQRANPPDRYGHAVTQRRSRRRRRQR